MDGSRLNHFASFSLEDLPTESRGGGVTKALQHIEEPFLVLSGVYNGLRTLNLAEAGTTSVTLRSSYHQTSSSTFPPLLSSTLRIVRSVFLKCDKETLKVNKVDNIDVPIPFQLLGRFLVRRKRSLPGSPLSFRLLK